MKYTLTYALTVLECNSSSTLDEVKSKYRTLAKKHHPDAGGDSNKFIALTECYDLVMKNHKPTVKVAERPAEKKTKKFENVKLYRVLDSKRIEHVINLPFEDEVLMDVDLYLMWGSLEVRVTLHKGMKLPTTLISKNTPLTLRLRGL